MQLLLQGKNFVISDRVRDYVEKKIGKLDRYLPDVEEARVEITQEKTKSAKDRNIVQITLKANGTILRAEERSDAIYPCIDAVANKIHRQIVRYKGKREDRWHGGHKREVDPMSENEAVEQMELLGHNFFVFFNAELGRINVIYRRSDDNYGLIDPDVT